MKMVEFNNTELFYLEDFLNKEWFKFVDTIVDRDNMSQLDKNIDKSLKNMIDKIREARLDKCRSSVADMSQYKYQDKYKLAWESLKECMNDERYCPCYLDMLEIEKKFNIGSDKQ